MDITGYPKEGGKLGDLGAVDQHHPAIIEGPPPCGGRGLRSYADFVL